MPKSINNLAEGPAWFAVQVKTTHEKRVASLLGFGGHEWFLPLYACRRRWSDRIKQVECPLFPGYIFCRFDVSARVPILKTPSVVGIVGIGHTPAPIDEQEIIAIRRVVQSGFGMSPHPFLQVGNRVRIDSGSLSGLEGFIEGVRPGGRLILNLTLLQRSVAVKIDRAWVKPIHTSSKPISCPKPLSRSA